MVARAYRNQVVKAGSVKKAGAAFDAAKGRVNWSQQLRDDHRLMAAVEKLLKRASDGKHVPVRNARMGMPVISVLAGAATNSHVLGDTSRQARHYGATMLLAEKHGLELPANLRRSLEVDEDGESDEDLGRQPDGSPGGPGHRFRSANQVARHAHRERSTTAHARGE